MNGKFRQVGNPQSLQCKAHARLYVVADHRGGQLQLGFSGHGSQSPWLQLAAMREAVVQTMVLHQISRLPRCPSPRQIVWRSHQQRTESPEPACCEARVTGLARAHHGIEAVLYHVNHLVGEVQVQRDLGVLAHELAEHRQHQRASERLWHHPFGSDLDTLHPIPFAPGQRNSSWIGDLLGHKQSLRAASQIKSQ